MKNILFQFILPVLLAFSLAGCKKDHGNYDYRPLGDFYIDSANIKKEFIAKQFDTLKLAPKVVYAGDRSKLSYRWTVYDSDKFYGERTGVETLSASESLASRLMLLPNKYILQYTVTDTESGRSAVYLYKMTVESGSGLGIMVLYEKNNLVDFDIIQTKLLAGLLEKDEVSRAMYSTANPGHLLTGNAVAIGMYKTKTAQFIDILTDNDGLQLSPNDMVISRSFDDQFLVKPLVRHIEGYNPLLGTLVPVMPYFSVLDYESSLGATVLINNGAVYVNQVGASNGKANAYALAYTAGDDYKAAPFVFGPGSPTTVYDDLKMRFIGVAANSVIPVTTGVNTAFDLKNINKKIVYGGAGYGGGPMAYTVFKNPVDDGKRFLYLTDFTFAKPVTAKYAWDISSYPGIADAKLFTLGRRGPLMYYVGNNKIYQIKYDITGGTINGAVNAWTDLPAGEEITCMKLFPHAGRNLAESAADKYLYVATYNNTTKKGKVYLLEVNISSGVLKQTPVAVFEDFGKIKDMALKI